MISYYHTVARRIRLHHDIFDSLNSSKNEDIKAVSVVVSPKIMVHEHVAAYAVDIRILKLPVKNTLEHVVQSANSVTSIFVVPSQNAELNAEPWDFANTRRENILRESVAVGFQAMSQDENVGFDVSDDSVV